MRVLAAYDRGMEAALRCVVADVFAFAHKQPDIFDAAEGLAKAELLSLHDFDVSISLLSTP
jgi:hypothetical protein